MLQLLVLLLLFLQSIAWKRHSISMFRIVCKHTKALSMTIQEKDIGKTLYIPSFSKTCSPWTVCTFCVILEQGKCVEIFFFVLMRSTE
jgi:hypothetical protein